MASTKVIIDWCFCVFITSQQDCVEKVT